MTDSRRSALATLGWAAYLACSWTWCIGMFLPVLLVRDFGVWGFVVFAVPNVLGAAAMGWVLRDGDAAARLRERHRAATELFSFVTVLFQWFFLAAFVAPSAPAMDFGFGIAAAIAVVAAMLVLLGRGHRKPGWLHAAAFVVFAASIVAATVFLSGEGGARFNPAITRRQGVDLAMLAPVVIFGFVLCPYLDRTFLRARMETGPGEGGAAFTIGFVGLFFPLILFTLFYTPAIAFLPAPVVFGVATAAATALLLHMTIQLFFTIGVHLIESDLVARRRPGWAVPVFVLVLVIVFAASYLRGRDGAIAIAGLSAVELMYRLFMSFYGLLFPAYVWLCMIPARAAGTGERHSGIEGTIGRRKLLVLLVAVTIAAPMYWFGFIERQEVWLLPGLAVVLLSRAAVGGGFLPPLRAKRER